MGTGASKLDDLNKSTTSKVGSSIKSTASKTGVSIKSAASKVVDNIHSTSSKSGSSIKSTASKAGSSIKSTSSKAGGATKAGGKGALNHTSLTGAQHNMSMVTHGLPRPYDENIYTRTEVYNAPKGSVDLQCENGYDIENVELSLLAAGKNKNGIVLGFHDNHPLHKSKSLKVPSQCMNSQTCSLPDLDTYMEQEKFQLLMASYTCRKTDTDTDSVVSNGRRTKKAPLVSGTKQKTTNVTHSKSSGTHAAKSHAAMTSLNESDEEEDFVNLGETDPKFAEIHPKSSGAHSTSSSMHSKSGGTHPKLGRLHSKSSNMHSKSDGTHSKSSGAHSTSSSMHSKSGGTHPKLGELHSKSGGIHASKGHATKTSHNESDEEEDSDEDEHSSRLHSKSGETHPKSSGMHPKSGGTHPKSSGIHPKSNGTHPKSSGTHPKSSRTHVAKGHAAKTSHTESDEEEHSDGEEHSAGEEDFMNLGEVEQDTGSCIHAWNVVGGLILAAFVVRQVYVNRSDIKQFFKKYV
jgi:hypothetical protein